MNRFDRYERLGRCECGAYLSKHPPLPRPAPLQSWHAARTSTPLLIDLQRPNAAQVASHERFMRLRAG